MITRPTLLLTLVLATLAPGAAAEPPPLRAAIEADYAHLGPLFEHFHRNPELSYVEFETAKRLATELRDAGATVTEGVGGTGVVGVLENGDGPVVMIRADMDGLPIEERSGLPYASDRRQQTPEGQEYPVMHACGHDVHMTVLVGVARRLAALREAWSGTVLFVGQPAEERIGGARAMIEDGLYDRFPRPDLALAMHVSSTMRTGTFRLDPGLAFSGSDSLDVIVHGVGSHGAYPHLGKDPVVIGAQLVLALQTLVSRELSPTAPGVVTVGSFHAGTKHNIISDRAVLQLTVRSDAAETRETLLGGIRRIAEHVGRAAGLDGEKLPEVSEPVASTPPTVNDPALTARVRAAIARRFGEDAFVTKPRTGMGAEDFSYFLQVEPPVPGAYFRVGGTPAAVFAAAQAGGPPVPAHHSPLFRIAPRPAVLDGVEAMVLAVLELAGATGAEGDGG